MSNDTGRPRPNVVQYIAYCYGRVLPESMRDWVRNDLGGKGATGRTVIRFAIPAILVLAPFWLIPTTLYVHASMTLPIFLPYLLFTHALNKVWRRHMLSKHGLDPALADEYKRSREAPIHRAYIERYGPGRNHVRTLRAADDATWAGGSARRVGDRAVHCNSTQ